MDPGRVRLGKKVDRLEEYFFSNFLFIIFRNGDRYLQRIMVIKKKVKYNIVTSLRWYGLEILRNIPGSRSSDVLDFRSSISKSFSVLVPTTEGDLASVHCKSTTQEKRPDQPLMEDVLFLPR